MPTGSRSSGKIDTLNRIIKAAREEFAAKGLESAHIQDIAERAGVTKQLIYHYYENKENLFACVLDESSAAAMAELVALELDDIPPAEAMRQMLYHVFDFFHNDPILSDLAPEGIRYHKTHDTPRNGLVEFGPDLTSKMNDIIQRGIKNGLFKDELNTDYVFAAAVLIVCGPYTQKYLIEALGSVDLDDETNVESWKIFAADMVLAALSKR